MSEGEAERGERERDRQTKRKLCNIVGVHLFLITTEIVLMSQATCPQSFIKGGEC